MPLFPTPPRFWIAVASADHVRLGRAGGFMQVCHGKRAPLARLKGGDGVIYYSPSQRFRENDGLRSFTAVGRVLEGTPYPFDMGGGFVPFRRDVTWTEARESPIKPLLQSLDFTRDNRNWGYQLRFGLFEIGQHDYAVIEQAMTALPDRSGDLLL